VNALSTKDLRNLFKLRTGTPSDTHDKLRCERCLIIHDNAELEAKKVLPKQLAACRELLELLRNQEDAKYFLKQLVASEHGSTKEAYEKIVKQPMDSGTILGKLAQPPEHAAAYSSVSGFSKDVNRIFSNVMKVWSPGDAIADASRRLQSWWVEQWTEVVPRLMTMKACDDDEEEKSEEDEDPVDAALGSCISLRNERGEEYQEQIGMPDEENMRQWSHHHSTDTVDDPVFRAAMRGFDSVSFVFGLEVTWSLIQERQQEEEERLAMKELEAMQGMQVDEEEETADVAGEDTKPPAVASKESDPENPFCDEEDEEETADVAGEDTKPPAVDSKASDPENAFCDSDSDDDGGGEDCVVQLDDGGDSSSGEDCVVQQDDGGDSSSGEDNVEQEDREEQANEDVVLVDSPVQRTATKRDMTPMDSLATVTMAPPSTSGKSTPYAEAEIFDSSPESCAIEAEVCFSHHTDQEESSVVDATQDTNASSQLDIEKENVSVAPTNEWACTTCTLHNRKSLRKCSACGTRKPPQQTNKRSIAQLSK
jgi:hypothetical protein